jgi:dTDP-4-amino-4,6-dideoxygalactose transaminase
VASANCGLYCGAQVDFVDIDPRTYNLCPQALERKLEKAERDGKLPKVVVAVHLCGQPCDMAAIHALSRQYGFKIIEDASHAIGGRYQGLPIGNGAYSDITVLSFHPVKIITSGEGGMAVTNDPLLWGKMKLLRSHGICSDKAEMKPRAADEIWNYQQIELGFNYRMTDIHAALGLSQMHRLDDFVMRRQNLAQRYNELLSGMPVVTPWQHPDSFSSFHLYVIRLELDGIALTQRQVYEALHAEGIFVNLHYIPVYRHPYYEQFGFKAGYCPEAELYYVEALSLPIYAALTNEQQNHVVQTLKSILVTQ